MHYAALAVGDQHAELWEELGITHRRVEAGEDVSVAEHPSLGRCIISHTGLEDRVEWWSERPIEVWDPAPEPRPVPAVAPGLLLRVTGRRPCRIRL